MSQNNLKMIEDELTKIIKATHLFEKIYSKEAVKDLISESNLKELQKGEVLFHEGDDGDAMYVVIKGLLNVKAVTRTGEELQIRQIEPGEIVGEIQLLTGGKRTASICAEANTVLLELKKVAYDRISIKHPVLIEEVNSIIRSRLKNSQLLAMLPNLFGVLDAEMLTYIKKQIDWVFLKKGETLFRQGDIANSCFILITGRLSVINKDQLGNKREFGVIRPGEIAGEMGMMSEQPRTTSIIAGRDSDLIKVERTAFERIIEKYPQIAMPLMKTFVNRFQEVRTPGQQRDNVVNFAILPTSNKLPLSEFATRLYKALSNFGNVLHLNASYLDKYWNIPGMSQATIDDPRYPRLSSWLDELETKYDFILYEADTYSSEWTQKCIQQADHVLIAGWASSDPALGEIETGLYSEKDGFAKPQFSLILIHPDGHKLPNGTKRWLDHRRVDRYHHVCWDRDQDFEKVARFLTGNVVGLVLGGGGARGLAHLGVIRALEEFGIPVDAICGTSMGSIIAASLAIGWNKDIRLKKAKKSFVDNNPLGDYTLPLVALFKSRKLDDSLHETFKDVCIEDLWLNYFCVSSNLTTAELVIHDKGPVWRACRASLSLPGILMPVVDQSCLLVDGGLINNLPADIMRERYGGFVMMSNVSPDEDLQIPDVYKTMPSTTKLLWSRINPFRKKIEVPTIGDILMRTIMLSCVNQMNRVKNEVDYYFNPPVSEFGMLDFQSLFPIIDTAYQYTKKELQAWKFLSEEIWGYKFSQSASV